jgi:hypothetical protein
MEKTVVKLRGELTPPETWQEAGFESSRHIHVDNVEEVEDETYRLITERLSEQWYISREQVVDVRPPGHPGHPENL